MNAFFSLGSPSNKSNPTGSFLACPSVALLYMKTRSDIATEHFSADLADPLHKKDIQSEICCLA
jgi:hypothetical protein